MKSPTKTTIAMFGGAAAIALTVGFGGVGVSSTSTAPVHPNAAAPAAGKGVHAATLTGCVSGLDC